MKTIRYILLFFCVMFVCNVSAQTTTKHVQHLSQLWLAYFNQTRFSSKWGLWADIQIRTKEDFIEDFSTFIARAGLMYYLNDNTKLTLGYAFVNSFPQDGRNVSQPEHRPWQQIQWHTNYKRVKTMQYLRLEERFRRKVQDPDHLGEGYDFNFRVRYNFLLQVPLSKRGPEPGTFSFIANDEIHINFGKEIVYNTFDQNRFFLGFAYHTTKSDNLQFGYLNVFQQLSSGSNYKSINGARISYFHNLDLRKKSGSN